MCLSEALAEEVEVQSWRKLASGRMVHQFGGFGCLGICVCDCLYYFAQHVLICINSSLGISSDLREVGIVCGLARMVSTLRDWYDKMSGQ